MQDIALDQTEQLICSIVDIALRNILKTCYDSYQSNVQLFTELSNKIIAKKGEDKEPVNDK